MEVIDHFLHTHPLVLTESENDNVYCSGCGRGISGSLYGCFPCMYYLHKSCALLPPEIQNFFHPCPLVLTVLDHLDWTCNACFKRVSGFSYRCVFCDFDMHVECVQRPTIESEELVQHFTHWHPLKLADSNRNLEAGCAICDELCSASESCLYGCGECNFFIHKSCMMDIPQQINHSFHPSCPLILVTDLEQRHVSDNSCWQWHECSHNPHWWEANNSCWFKCSDNSYWFDLSEKSYWVEGSQNSYWFKGSQNSCWSELYWWCVRSYNSYQCEGCDEVCSGLAFRCGKCNFQLDVKCALLPTVESKDAYKIQHLSHKHPLVLCQDKEFTSEIRCRACGENCLLGLDPCFGCSRGSCDFFLHRTCAVKLPREVHHDFHPLHPLIQFSDSDFPYRCKGCDDSHEGSDLAYRCVECGFQLDVKCALFPTIESKDADKIMHCAHKHPLALFESKEFGNEVRCRSCGESCLDPSFGCKECNFFLHRHCATELHSKKREIHHPFHPLHTLTLWSPQPLPHRDTFQCSSCLGSDDVFLLRYHCAKCYFDLHIDCSKPSLTTFFKYEGHKHHLTYFDKTLIPIQCNICHDDVQSCFFRCVACSYNMHIYCIPSTPRTIQYNRHSHPLTVTKPPFEYELISPKYADGSDDEFYCDACEEKRYKFESVYYCAECKFIAEVCCVISELLPSLNITEEQGGTNGRGISRDEETELEANIEKVNKEIAELRTEKRPLKIEIKERRSTLKPLEERLEQINLNLKELEVDLFLYNHMLDQNMKGKNPTEASTSRQQTADLP